MQLGVKEAIRNDQLSREKLISLRDRIDELTVSYPDISFISFADSLVLKSHWTVGHFESDVEYTYRPELFFMVFQKLQDIYRETLSLEIYAIFTQGSNEFYDDVLLHISESKRHICLNSLGTPFADLQSIDSSVRKSLKENIHKPTELYLDEDFYNSLKFDFNFDKKVSGKYKYTAMMKNADSFYYLADCQTIINNLK